MSGLPCILVAKAGTTADQLAKTLKTAGIATNAIVASNLIRHYFFVTFSTERDRANAQEIGFRVSHRTFFDFGVGAPDAEVKQL